MKHIVKYSLSAAGFPTSIAIDRDPIGFSIQDGFPTVWVEDAGGPYVGRQFVVAGLGSALPDEARHWGSIADGGIVWHLYEIPT
jgi:hypothetical protein